MKKAAELLRTICIRDLVKIKEDGNMTKEMMYKFLDETYGYQTVQEMIQEAWMTVEPRKAVKMVHALVRNIYLGRAEVF